MKAAVQQGNLKLCVYQMCKGLVIFYEHENVGNIASWWVHRESNLMFTSSSDKKSKKSIRFRVCFLRCKWNLSVCYHSVQINLMIAEACGSTGPPDHGTFCDDYYPCLNGDCIIDDYYSFWCNCSEGYVGQFCECKLSFFLHTAVNIVVFHHPDDRLKVCEHVTSLSPCPSKV